MKKTYVTAIAAAVAMAAVCAMLFCGCAASPLDEEWEFEVLIKGGQAVACAPGIAERYPEAEAGDIAIELTDGRITVTADGEIRKSRSLPRDRRELRRLFRTQRMSDDGRRDRLRRRDIPSDPGVVGRRLRRLFLRQGGLNRR